MIHSNIDSPNRARLLMPTLLASVALAAASCGGPDDTTEIEPVSGAIHNVGRWVTPLTGTFLAEPALARNVGGPMTAFGLGMDSNIYVTRQDNSEIWSQSWTLLTGGAFTSAPAVTAIRQTSGPLTQRFAIVARRSDNKYYITIRDSVGAITVDWTPIPMGTFFSAPAITHLSPSSPIGPTNTLFLAGRRSDGRIGVVKNTLLASGNFSNSNWVDLGSIQSDTFVSAPAIAPPCDFIYAGPGVFIVARQSDGTFRSTKWNGSSFSSWAAVANGIFNDGPALATGCGAPAAEVVIYGLGLDNLVYYSTQLTGGPAAFTSIGTKTFQGSPAATGFVSTMGVNSVMVGAIAASPDPAAMFTSTASAH